MLTRLRHTKLGDYRASSPFVGAGRYSLQAANNIDTAVP